MLPVLPPDTEPNPLLQHNCMTSMTATQSRIPTTRMPHTTVLQLSQQGGCIALAAVHTSALIIVAASCSLALRLELYMID